MISEILATQHKKNAPKTVGDYLATGGQHGFGLLLFFLALPSALPIPAPGYGTIFGAFILLVAAQLCLGMKEPWLPSKFKKRSLQLTLNSKSRWVRFLLWIEAIIKPRWAWVFWGQSRLVGLSVMVAAVIMCIPLPGTNTLPAIGILVTAMGLIQRDGLLTFLGVLFNLSLVLLMFGLLNWLMSWFGPF